MAYRKDIDGLRALSVIAVILFHSGFPFASGGFIGVDVFFVISGYLITSLVRGETTKGTFSSGGFYRRRAARLIPALLVTLAGTLVFGFVFYDNSQFDNLGKEVLFSAFGIANILFAQGGNYFASDTAATPLLHLWSLGVEEQFYLVWPIFLLVSTRWSKTSVWISTAGLFALSLTASTLAAPSIPTAAYFYPQYRVFELLLGALLALTGVPRPDPKTPEVRLSAEILAGCGLGLIFGCLITLNEESVFPGINALWPCLGAALILAYGQNSYVGKFLGLRPLVAIGLISYPLYLYHQPIISWYRYFEPDGTSTRALLVLTLSVVPLSTLTYLYLERPVRRLVHQSSPRSGSRLTLVLVGGLITLGLLGLLIAKQNGWPSRFKVLNSFAFDVSAKHSSSFHQYRKRGYDVTSADHGKILFVGDSVLQQYVAPIGIALNIAPSEMDSVTRGGCVLLKGVEFEDKFSDISCDDIRENLYASSKTYDYVVISQQWEDYDLEILNRPHSIEPKSLEKWTSFLEDTLRHFSALARHVIIIGLHPKVAGTAALKASIFLDEKNYREKLTKLKLINRAHLAESKNYFARFETTKQNVWDLEDVWCEKNIGCQLHDGTWSFFSDPHHITSASSPFLVKRFRLLIQSDLKTPTR